MFIAHMPAAYLLFKTVAPRMPKAAFFAGLVGSVVPDLDLFWFYFVDGRAHHHHDYITHRPFLWLLVFALGVILHRYGSRHVGGMTMAFGAGAMLHMFLDTVAGKIGWLWPFSNIAKPFVIVPATHENWIMSFLTHWTFQVEIAIVTIAALVLIKQARQR